MSEVLKFGDEQVAVAVVSFSVGKQPRWPDMPQTGSLPLPYQTGNGAKFLYANKVNIFALADMPEHFGMLLVLTREKKLSKPYPYFKNYFTFYPNTLREVQEQNRDPLLAGKLADFRELCSDSAWDLVIYRNPLLNTENIPVDGFCVLSYCLERQKPRRGDNWNLCDDCVSLV